MVRAIYNQPREIVEIQAGPYLFSGDGIYMILALLDSGRSLAYLYPRGELEVVPNLDLMPPWLVKEVIGALEKHCLTSELIDETGLPKNVNLYHFFVTGKIKRKRAKNECTRTK